MDAKTLLARKASANTGTVDLADGVTIKVRGLTRGEVMIANKLDDDGKRDEMVAHMAMLSPKMTVAQTAQWFKDGLAGDTEAVLLKIRDLSGLGEGARKSSETPPGE